MCSPLAGSLAFDRTQKINKSRVVMSGKSGLSMICKGYPISEGYPSMNRSPLSYLAVFNNRTL